MEREMTEDEGGLSYKKFVLRATALTGTTALVTLFYHLDLLYLIWAFVWLVVLVATIAVVDRHGSGVSRRFRMRRMSWLGYTSNRIALGLAIIVAISHPVWYELPKDRSGVSVATVKDGEVIYYPYGLVTIPFIGAPKVMSSFDLNTFVSSAETLSRVNGVEGTVTASATMVVDNRDAYFLYLDTQEGPSIGCQLTSALRNFLIDGQSLIRNEVLEEKHQELHHVEDALYGKLTDKFAGIGLRVDDVSVVFEEFQY